MPTNPALLGISSLSSSHQSSLSSSSRQGSLERQPSEQREQQPSEQQPSEQPEQQPSEQPIDSTQINSGLGQQTAGNIHPKATNRKSTAVNTDHHTNNTLLLLLPRRLWQKTSSRSLLVLFAFAPCTRHLDRFNQGFTLADRKWP